MTPRDFQLFALAKGLEFYAKHGFGLNTGYTPKNMLATASSITGKKYKRTQLLEAAADLRAEYERRLSNAT
jgi:hypothetical protein